MVCNNILEQIIQGWSTVPTRLYYIYKELRLRLLKAKQKNTNYQGIQMTAMKRRKYRKRKETKRKYLQTLCD